MSLEQTIDRVLSARAGNETPPSSEDVIARWQNDVEGSYMQVQDGMKPYVEAGKMTIERGQHEITEENLGTYAIDTLDLDVGDETIRLRPKATHVIGAYGRVDMIHLGSTEDHVLFVLIGEEQTRIWNIVDRSVRTKLNPLTKESLEYTIEKFFGEFSSRAGLVA